MIIRVLDWIDDSILRHRFYFICRWIGLNSWWGDEWSEPKDDDKDDLF